MLALLSLVVVWLLFWLREGNPLRPSPLSGALLVFFITVGIGICVTSDVNLTIPKATGLLLGFALWRYCMLYIQTRQALKWASVATVLLTLALTTVGVVSTEWQFEIPLVEQLLGVLPPRLIQLPEAPDVGVSRNQLAGMIISFLPLIAAMTVAFITPPRRIILGIGFFILFLLLSVLLFATQSRSAWIGAVLSLSALLILWWFVLPPSSTRRVLTILLFALMLSGIGSIQLFEVERLVEVWEAPPDTSILGDLTTLDYRREVWRWSLVAISDFPFTGCGLGAFRRVVCRFYPLNPSIKSDIAHAHNIFLQVALDTGLPGMIAYLAVLGVAFAVGLRVAREDIALSPLALGILASLIAQHIFGLADALSLGSKPGMIFWLFLGLVSGLEFTLKRSRASVYEA
jgi:putative inorganic carbon (HCO3(-)) transporter